MTNSQMLQRFHWNGGLIFKVFFGTPPFHSTPVGVKKMCYDMNLLLSIIYGIQCDFRQKSC